MATVTKFERDGIWYLNWVETWTEGGQLRRKQFRRTTKLASEPDAERLRLAKQAQLDAQEVPTPPQLIQGTPTLDDYIDRYLGDFQTTNATSYKRTAGIVRKILQPAFGHLPLDQITVARINEWKVERARQKSQRVKKGEEAETIRVSSVNKEIRVLTAMISKALEDGFLTKHPCKDVKLLNDVSDPLPRCYTDDELARLYQTHPVRRWWWQLYVNTGMRKAEGLSLKAEAITETQIRILSSLQRRTKSGKTRVIPLAPGARAALEHLPKKGHVLPHMHSNSMTRHFIKDAEKAGIGGSLHDLRHTFCSRLVMQGKSLSVVQKLAGHASIKTTERYSHLSPEFMQGALDNLDL